MNKSKTFYFNLKFKKNLEKFYETFYSNVVFFLFVANTKRQRKRVIF